MSLRLPPTHRSITRLPGLATRRGSQMRTYSGPLSSLAPRSSKSEYPDYPSSMETNGEPPSKVLRVRHIPTKALFKPMMQSLSDAGCIGIRWCTCACFRSATKTHGGTLATPKTCLLAFSTPYEAKDAMELLKATFAKSPLGDCSVVYAPARNMETRWHPPTTILKLYNVENWVQFNDIVDKHRGQLQVMGLEWRTYVHPLKRLGH